MKLTFIVVVVVFAVVANQSLAEDEDERDFRAFKKRFGKEYKDEDENNKRKGEYIKCRNFVGNHNEKFEKGEVSYEMKENRFCDLFEDERSEFISEQRVAPFEFEDYQVSAKAVGVVTNTMFPPAPATAFSWVDSNCITPIKDQGFYCDNCWAFSSIAALESHWCLKTGQLIRLSEQQLVDCNRDKKFGNFGCKGGATRLPSFAWFIKIPLQVLRTLLTCTFTTTAESKTTQLIRIRRTPSTLESILVATMLSTALQPTRDTGGSAR